jgi:hypothetical protein
MDERKFTLTKDTMIPLGMVISICAGVVWISSALSDINYKLETLNSKLEQQWTKADMENWSLRLKMNNPELQIPEVNQ